MYVLEYELCRAMQFGFVEDQRFPWDVEQAPQGWDYAKDRKPDVVYPRYPEELSRNPDDLRARIKALGPE